MMWQQHGTMKNSSFPVGRVKNAHGTYSEVCTGAYAIHKLRAWRRATVLNRVLNSSSEQQSSTTYRSFVQRYRECERNAGVQWSIDFNPHPRAWHIVSDDIIDAGSEMNVDTDEFLKSLKSLQVSRCECSAKNPDSDYPTSTRKPAPDSRRCTAGARRDRPEPAARERLLSVHAGVAVEHHAAGTGVRDGGKLYLCGQVGRHRARIVLSALLSAR